MSTIIAIDPGKSGGICVKIGSGITLYDTPVIKGDKTHYDTKRMSDILGQFDDLNPTVVIERQQAMPKQGVSSTFQTGMGYGLWLGIIAGLQLPHEVIAPATWKKAMLADMPPGKESSRLKALQLFPYLADDLKLKKHEARAEALLLAVYYERYRLNK